MYLEENPQLGYWSVWGMVGKICSVLYAVNGKSRGPDKFIPKLMPKPPKKDR